MIVVKIRPLSVKTSSKYTEATGCPVISNSILLLYLQLWSVVVRSLHTLIISINITVIAGCGH